MMDPDYDYPDSHHCLGLYEDPLDGGGAGEIDVVDGARGDLGTEVVKNLKYKISYWTKNTGIQDLHIMI